MHANNPEFEPHFTQLAAGRLCFPFCTDCQRFHWYPLPLCPHCQSSQAAWRQVSGQGELYSWTEIHHAFDVRYNGPLPYIVALISFADAPGVRLVSNMLGVAADALVVGMSVTADFSNATAGDRQLVFRPTAA